MSRLYPTHEPQCGCSGCYASHTEDRAIAPYVAKIEQLRIALKAIVADAEQRDDFEVFAILDIARKALEIE